MVDVYCDESHDDKVAVLAGWVATPTGWDGLTPAWNAMLGRHPMPDGTRMPGFHASEIVGRDQISDSRFRGWTRDQEIAVFSDAVDQIVDTKVCALLWPIGCAIRLPPIKGARMTDDTWRILFIHMFFMLLNKFPAQNGFSFMFDEKPEVRDPVNQFYYEAKEVVNKQSPGKIHGDVVGFGNDEDHAPLQAADLWAYEWRKRISVCVNNSDAVPRRSFRRIFDARRTNHAMQYYPLLALKEIFDRQANGENFYSAMASVPCAPESFWAPSEHA